MTTSIADHPPALLAASILGLSLLWQLLLVCVVRVARRQRPQERGREGCGVAFVRIAGVGSSAAALFRTFAWSCGGPRDQLEAFGVAAAGIAVCVIWWFADEADAGRLSAANLFVIDFLVALFLSTTA